MSSSDELPSSPASSPIPKKRSFGDLSISPIPRSSESLDGNSEGNLSHEPHGVVPIKPIHLQVGERHFTTSLFTIAESGLLSAACKDNRDSVKERAYDPVFIDADGDLFVHILSYLRRKILPVFYTAQNGHNHGLYHALLQEAKDFQIPRLEKWLKGKTYLNVVKFEYCVVSLETTSLLTVVPANEEVQLHSTWTTKKVYVCPRSIPVHKSQMDCGKLCEKARGEDGECIYEDEPVMKITQMKKRVVYADDLCMPEGKNSS
jgi:hypothetical protein